MQWRRARADISAWQASRTHASRRVPAPAARSLRAGVCMRPADIYGECLLALLVYFVLARARALLEPLHEAIALLEQPDVLAGIHARGAGPGGPGHAGSAIGRGHGCHEGMHDLRRAARKSICLFGVFCSDFSASTRAYLKRGCDSELGRLVCFAPDLWPAHARGDLTAHTHMTSSDTRRALWAYAASGADELSLAVGDIVHVLDRPGDGWWEGRVEGSNQQGMFPVNYTEPVEREDGATSSSPSYTEAASVRDGDAHAGDGSGGRADNESLPAGRGIDLDAGRMGSAAGDRGSGRVRQLAANLSNQFAVPKGPASARASAGRARASLADGGGPSASPSFVTSDAPDRAATSLANRLIVAATGAAPPARERVSSGEGAPLHVRICVVERIAAQRTLPDARLVPRSRRPLPPMPPAWLRRSPQLARMTRMTVTAKARTATCSTGARLLAAAGPPCRLARRLRRFRQCSTRRT